MRRFAFLTHLAGFRITMMHFIPVQITLGIAATRTTATLRPARWVCEAVDEVK